MCTICETNVSLTAKHCGRCNRCVENFDHHCKWLNNCVGTSNYKLFVGVIVTLELTELIVFGFGGFLVLEFAVDRGEFYEAVKELGEEKNWAAVLVFIIVNVSVAFLVAIALINLIILHIYLRVRHITTYEYIMEKRSRKKAKVMNMQKMRTVIAPSSQVGEPGTFSFVMYQGDTKQETVRSPKPLTDANNTIEAFGPDPLSVQHRLDTTDSKVTNLGSYRQADFKG